MNEAAAREVVLVRAVETTDDARTLWSDEDRAWASRAAAEVVGGEASPAAYIARRASLAFERLHSRQPALARALRAVRWRTWVGPALATVAFALGVVADQLGPSKRVNILAFPLLALLAWNIAVYAVIVLRGLWGLAAERGRSLGPLARVVGRIGRAVPVERSSKEPVVAAVLARFFGDWARASAPLAAARVGRCLHFAAFAFALGAIVGLYVRGLVLEYRAGWESTFLDPEVVHAVLSFVLGPASALTGIPISDVPGLEAIRFEDGGTGENAAPWIHLYAATVALVVLAPRFILGMGTWLVERRLTAHFPLRLDDPYYQRLARQVRSEVARVRIVPYSYQLPPQAVLGLQSIAARVFGTGAQLSVAPLVAWGAEEALPEALVPPEPLALVAIVYALAATPEPENHGAFVAAVAAQVKRGTPLAVILDESGFRKRFAQQPVRLEERRTAWRDLLAARRLEPVFVDLEAPDLAAAEAAIERGLRADAD